MSAFESCFQNSQIIFRKVIFRFRETLVSQIHNGASGKNENNKITAISLKKEKIYSFFYCLMFPLNPGIKRKQHERRNLDTISR